MLKIILVAFRFFMSEVICFHDHGCFHELMAPLEKTLENIIGICSQGSWTTRI